MQLLCVQGFVWTEDFEAEEYYSQNGKLLLLTLLSKFFHPNIALGFSQNKPWQLNSYTRICFSG